MYKMKGIITRLVIIVFVISVSNVVLPVFANSIAPLDGSVEGLWKGISNPFPAVPTNAISFVDGVPDDKTLVKTDYDGFTNAWTGNFDERKKSSMSVDGVIYDVLVVTRTTDTWKMGNYGQTVLFQIGNVGNANHSKETSKVKNMVRWSVDFKIDLSSAADSGESRLIEPIVWKTDGTAGSSNNGPVKFSKISNNKYKITNAMDTAKNVLLDSGAWYRIQMEFVVNDYTEKTALDTEANKAKMSVVLYSITNGMVSESPLAEWLDNSWTPISTTSGKLVDTFCQELNFLTFNPAILSYSIANAYMVREALYGNIEIFESDDKVKASATISTQFTVGGNYAEPSDEGTPVLVLAGYDNLNTLVNAKADIADLSTPMSCELDIDSKIKKYSVYLWKAPDMMQLFTSPKSLSMGE